jgi:hypothetical protein
MDREQLRDLTREELEELTWQLVEIARSLADKAKQNSTNSSRPPSSDDPKSGSWLVAAQTGLDVFQPMAVAASA